MLSKIFNHGILGINARNLLYIKPYNPRKAVIFADNKLATKHFFQARHVQFTVFVSNRASGAVGDDTHYDAIKVRTAFDEEVVKTLKDQELTVLEFRELEWARANQGDTWRLRQRIFQDYSLGKPG